MIDRQSYSESQRLSAGFFMFIFLEISCCYGNNLPCGGNLIKELAVIADTSIKLAAFVANQDTTQYLQK